MKKLLALAGLFLLAARQDGGLATRLDDLRAKQLPKGARLGILAVDLSNGAEIYRADSDASLAPASNTKLWTSAAALVALGKDFNFTTDVYASGSLAGGVLDGDLHVVAGGDPSISGRFYSDDPTAVFKAWAKALADAGIREVKGALRLHDPYGQDAFVHPDWKDYNPSEWWAAPVAAFTLNDNCIDLTMTPAAKEGQAPTIQASPATAFVKIVNKAETVEAVAKGKGIVWSRKPGSNEILFSGQIAVKARPPTWSVAIDDPEKFFATVLLETLKAQGIRVADGSIEDARAIADVPGARKVTSTSTDLARTLQVMNTRSQNLYAELVGRRVGFAASGKGTFEAGATAVTAWAAKIGAKKTTLVDGSGLSPNNRTTAEDVVHLLRHMYGQKDFAVWRDSLAVSGGAEGTLRSRLKEPRTKGRVHAKTGHLEGVDCLSGYIHTQHDRWVAFSILVNGHTDTDKARDMIDAIVTQLVEY